MLALEIFDDYISWLRVNVPLAYDNLAPPATASELAALEEAVGYELPSTVKAVLGVHNGQKVSLTPSGGEHGVPCIPTLNLLSTGAIQERWEIWAETRRGPDIEELQKMGGVWPGAEGLIRPLYTSPGWIPLWSDPTRHDYIGIDLDPAPGGKTGQIINFGRDEERHFLCAPDFTSLLQILLEEVRSGAWQASKLHDEEYEDDKIIEGGPWFGDPDEHFFNALYARFEANEDNS
ncbi:SMI1/KNR4 family protein [Nocardia altamirensis]|uniref:SMI1/KNR4 family protein n=1 Tax=Nocardia altamirensis TaxID=472158 RepID=UPI00084071B8|nr:SMI1/KNR4 family protein [Nocardia altamirensis]